MNNTFAVVTAHYIIINKQDRINLKNKKGKVMKESQDRIDLEIDGKAYNIPVSIIKKYNIDEKVYHIIK